jgi:hypothetical protein
MTNSGGQVYFLSVIWEIYSSDFWIKKVNKIIGEKQAAAEEIRNQQLEAAARAKSRR